MGTSSSRPTNTTGTSSTAGTSSTDKNYSTARTESTSVDSFYSKYSSEPKTSVPVQESQRQLTSLTRQENAPQETQSLIDRPTFRSFSSHLFSPRAIPKMHKIFTDRKETEFVSQCHCSGIVLDKMQTLRGIPLADLTTTILDVVAFKITFKGYLSYPNVKRFRRTSVPNHANETVAGTDQEIDCYSDVHTLFNDARIYTYEKLCNRIRHAGQKKDINSIKFHLMLARENEVKGLCEILCMENSDQEIRHTLKGFLKREFYKKYKEKFKVLKIWLGNKVPNDYRFTYKQFTPENLRFDTVVFNVEQNTQPVTDRSFCEFHLVIVSKNDCSTEAERLLQYESQEPTETAVFLSEYEISDLMNKHSNITMINFSRIHSYGYNSQNFHLQRTPTIVIYCQVKGVIPLGEPMFPEEINGFTVDVREGICAFAMEKIRISEQISAEECTKSGTLGGFIDIQRGKSFLTCAHVVLPTNVLKSNRASDYVQRREIRVFDKEMREIGRLTKAVFNHGQAAEVSIDAVIVEITDTRRYPCDGNFADVFSVNQLNGAGFSSAQGPHFSNGQIEQISTFNFRKQVIKIGASSGITLGWLRTGRSCAQIIDDYDIDIDGLFRIRLFGQLEVLPRIDPSQSSDSHQPFVRSGDSGALVFSICNDNPIVLKCIGIVVAMTSYGACLMTPIDKVLDALDLKYDCFSKFSVPSSSQQTDSEDLRSLLWSITQQLTVVQSNMATKGDIQNTNANIGNLKSDLEKFNDRLTMAEEEIQKTRGAEGNDDSH
ncbi:uncharacterized protein LOC133189170 [Saccostrea echinata]|uniref:uncharacterized protein LOC133189170 n=1 Tax=Saccostrea echinata TaxID=191078 RepID=UPI002A82BDD9|nr:uncharacterized protein LOC133189170 [Saccostrea echinata]